MYLNPTGSSPVASGHLGMRNEREGNTARSPIFGHDELEKGEERKGVAPHRS